MMGRECEQRVRGDPLFLQLESCVVGEEQVGPFHDDLEFGRAIVSDNDDNDDDDDDDDERDRSVPQFR